MVDRELAMKLAERFNKLSLDMDDPTLFSAEGSQVQQQIVIPELSPPPPPPPPPPPLQQQTPPFGAIPDSEWIDMDKLIGQTLHSLEVTSRKTPNNVLSSMDYAQKPLKKPSGSMNAVDTLLQVQTINHSDINETNDSSSLSPKCTAPIIPIVHHKNSHEQSKKIVSNDPILQKERDELEAKLAKQRQKKPTIPMEAESAAPFTLIGINAAEESRIASGTEKSELISLTNPLPPPVLPKNTSADLNLTESQWKDSRKPPPISKKPTSSVSFINLSVQ
ncbi:hypothetical protein LOAG_13452 [Loa loa]|uniref:WH2 domain-containing protein n=1 Tax=Loa loa TaxID=7209 RepID=A0A1I7VQP8_LOALO|nr:hypothetical protein LOAG_13452 [Loa loa]EFO15063.1 hypothetical protein LOAG_13452 [Loa loa]